MINENAECDVTIETLTNIKYIRYKDGKLEIGDNILDDNGEEIRHSGVVLKALKRFKSVDELINYEFEVLEVSIGDEIK